MAVASLARGGGGFFLTECHTSYLYLLILNHLCKIWYIICLYTPWNILYIINERIMKTS